MQKYLNNDYVYSFCLFVFIVTAFFTNSSRVHIYTFLRNDGMIHAGETDNVLGAFDLMESVPMT